MGRFAREVDDFIAAFKTGNEIGYKMRYLRYLEKQQELNQFKALNRQPRGNGGMPNDTQDLINQGRDKRFGPGSENEAPKTEPTKQQTVQPKKADIPDATPTTKAAERGSSDGATPQGKSGGDGSSGGDKHAGITDKYPGSYQTASLETGTMNDASPVRSAVNMRPLGGGAGGASPVAFGTNSTVMYRALTDLGVKPQVAAGAVGSMMGESGRHLNPSAYNPNDRGKPSGGALQWRAERLEGLYNFAGTRDINKIPIETQAKYMQRELQGSERGALDALLKGNTVADGTSAWTHKFERPAEANSEVARRTPMGEQFWKTIESGNIASTTGNRNQDAGNTKQQTAALETGTKTDAAPAVAQTTTPTNGATPPTAATPTTPSTSAVPASDVPLPPKRPSEGELNPEFPNNKGQPAPEPPRRPEMGPPAPEAVPSTSSQPGQEALQPASQPTADASQQGGWDFLDQLGQGFDQLGADIQSFFNDLSVPADWDVGSSAGADMGGGDFGGGDFGGGDFFGGIGGALGGLFNRGGMVR